VPAAVGWAGWHRQQGRDQRPELIRYEVVSKGCHGAGSCQTNLKGAKRRLSGLAVIAGAYAAYRQVQTARQGQVTERYTHTAEQLGNENVDVRVAAIFALERIAAASPNDRASLVDVIAAFVRRHVPWPPVSSDQPGQSVPIEEIAELGTRAPDVQAAQLVLCRRPLSHMTQPLNLGFADLRRAGLLGLDLRRARLSGAQLDASDLSRANLQKARLDSAWLRKAWLVDAQLQGADLHEAKLQEADLRRAQLQRSNLQGAQLRGTDLRGANLRGANLDSAVLQDAVCDAKTAWPERWQWRASGVREERST
jgi:hypothetical protein